METLIALLTGVIFLGIFILIYILMFVAVRDIDSGPYRIDPSALCPVTLKHGWCDPR